MSRDDVSQHLRDLVESRDAAIVVIGQGYVGLPVAMRAVEVGFRSVVGFDLAEDRVTSLRAGRSFVGDVSDEELDTALRSGYTPSSDPSDLTGFDIAVISVPTPLRDGAPDLSYIESAGRTLASRMRPGCCVILESTTYPGTTSGLLAGLMSEGSGLDADEYFLGYSPERIDPGNTTHTLVNTPKVVSGTDGAALAAVDAFFSTLVDETVPVANTQEAELVKLLENTFRHVNIALVNELAMFARELDVDIWRAIDAASTKPFGFMRFTPGPGVGGHCLPIDPSYLAWSVRQQLGRPFRFVELANDVNEHMPSHVHGRIASLLNERRKCLNGSRVLLLGLAYKRNTSDWRESPSIELADLLDASGADVQVCDPNIPDVNATTLDRPLVDFTPENLAAADVVVYLVDHDAFDRATVSRHSTLVFDAINALREEDFTGDVL